MHRDKDKSKDFHRRDVDSFFGRLLCSDYKNPKKTIRDCFRSYTRLTSNRITNSYVHQSFPSFWGEKTGIERRWDHFGDEKQESVKSGTKNGRDNFDSACVILRDIFARVYCVTSETLLPNLCKIPGIQEDGDDFFSISFPELCHESVCVCLEIAEVS